MTKWSCKVLAYLLSFFNIQILSKPEISQIQNGLKLKFELKFKKMFKLFCKTLISVTRQAFISFLTIYKPTFPQCPPSHLQHSARLEFRQFFNSFDSNDGNSKNSFLRVRIPTTSQLWALYLTNRPRLLTRIVKLVLLWKKLPQIEIRPKDGNSQL